MTDQLYLDYCATTPIHPTVREAMLPALGDLYGNPSSLHWAGRQAAASLQTARQQVADLVGAQPGEVVFTSGATEANNLALRGVMQTHAPGTAHLITTQIEHHAVLHTALWLESAGYTVTYLPVDGEGLVDPDDLRQAIRPDTVLISIMMVNNEVGTVQPVRTIGQIAHEHGILFHTDAVQGAGLLDVDLPSMEIDLLVLSAHKLYGPKGSGALVVREGVQLDPILFGGAQEHLLRAGTENVPGIVGLGAAAALMHSNKSTERRRLRDLRQHLIDQLSATIPAVCFNGPQQAVVPHVLSASFPGTDGEMMLFRLNQNGIALSMGSACTSESIEPSHVLLAMGLPLEHIEGTLRISLGLPTTADDIDYFARCLPDIVEYCPR